jgi:hypothetical protein
MIALVRTQAGGLLVLASLGLEKFSCRRLPLEHRGHADVYAQPIAVLYQDMSAKAQLGFFILVSCAPTLPPDRSWRHTYRWYACCRQNPLRRDHRAAAVVYPWT